MATEKRPLPLPVPGKQDLTYLLDAPGTPRTSIEVIYVPLGNIEESDRFRLRQPPYPNIEGLAQDIREKGQSTPLFVRPHPDDAERWELISGYRRLEALKRAEAPSAICRLYRGISDIEAYDLALSENQARDSLTDMERADICLRLQKEGKNVEGIAARMGWSTERWVYEHLKLAKKAPLELREALQNRRLSLRVGLDLVDELTHEVFSETEKRKQILETVIEEELSGKRLKLYLARMKSAVSVPTEEELIESRGLIRDLRNGGFAISARVDPKSPEEFDDVLLALQDAMQRLRSLKRKVEKDRKVTGEAAEQVN